MVRGKEEGAEVACLLACARLLYLEVGRVGKGDVIRYDGGLALRTSRVAGV